MNEQQPISPRRRLQELLAIPERQRTDAQWDELNEIEITLASTNRVETQGQGGARQNSPPLPKHPKPSGGEQVRKPARKFGRRPPKAPASPGGNG